jgi:hypothetical protein
MQNLVRIGVANATQNARIGQAFTSAICLSSPQIRLQVKNFDVLMACEKRKKDPIPANRYRGPF